MTRRNAWVASIGFGLLWAGLRYVYIGVQGSSQLKEMNNSPNPLWLAIAVAYFLADLLLVLTYMYIVKSPLGQPLPKGFPFWYVASDAAVLVFLVHLSLLCAEHAVYMELESVGLSFAYLVFLLSAACWAVVSGMRYVSVRKLYLRES